MPQSAIAKVSISSAKPPMKLSGDTSGTPRNDDSSHLSSHSKLVNGRFMIPPMAARNASVAIGNSITGGDSWGGWPTGAGTGSPYDTVGDGSLSSSPIA